MTETRFEYRPSISSVSETINTLAATGPYLVAISGYGGSGKSILARTFARILRAPVVGIDEFGTPCALQRSSDWAGLDRERLTRQVLEPIRQGKHTITYDSCDDWKTWHAVPVTVEFGHIVIVEGVGIFHPNVLPYFNYRIWLDVDLDSAIERGIAREHRLGNEQADTWIDIWGPNDVDFERRFNPRDHADVIMRPVVSS